MSIGRKNAEPRQITVNVSNDRYFDKWLANWLKNNPEWEVGYIRSSRDSCEVTFVWVGLSGNEKKN